MGVFHNKRPELFFDLFGFGGFFADQKDDCGEGGAHGKADERRQNHRLAGDARIVGRQDDHRGIGARRLGLIGNGIYNR